MFLSLERDWINVGCIPKPLCERIAFGIYAIATRKKRPLKTGLSTQKQKFVFQSEGRVHSPFLTHRQSILTTHGFVTTDSLIRRLQDCHLPCCICGLFSAILIIVKVSKKWCGWPQNGSRDLLKPSTAILSYLCSSGNSTASWGFPAGRLITPFPYPFPQPHWFHRLSDFLSTNLVSTGVSRNLSPADNNWLYPHRIVTKL